VIPAVRSALCIHWDDVPAATYFRVTRNGQHLGDTPLTFLHDSPVAGEGSYTVEAIAHDGAVLARGASEYRVETLGDRDPPRVSADVTPVSVELSWPEPDGAPTSGYVVTRRSPGGEPVELGRVATALFGDQTFLDVPPPGEWVYEVSASGAQGEVGPAGVARATFPPPDLAALLELPLTELPTDAAVVGEVGFGKDGARFAAGHLILPHSDSMQLVPGTALSLTFRVESIDQMPVLASHGAWEQDGWFVQILSGALILRTPGGDVTGPPVTTGEWHTLQVAHHDGRFYATYDGEPLPQGTSEVPLEPCERDLIIGQYQAPAPQYQFRGTIRDLWIARGP
jgi:hypothetical protein